MRLLENEVYYLDKLNYIIINSKNKTFIIMANLLKGNFELPYDSSPMSYRLAKCILLKIDKGGNESYKQ